LGELVLGFEQDAFGVEHSEEVGGAVVEALLGEGRGGFAGLG